MEDSLGGWDVQGGHTDRLEARTLRERYVLTSDCPFMCPFLISNNLKFDFRNVLYVLCVLCVVGFIFRTWGPLLKVHCDIRPVSHKRDQACRTLVDRLPGPQATARSRLMTKRKVSLSDGGADQAHIYRTVTSQASPTTPGPLSLARPLAQSDHCR
jgi:hypothetical protein